MFDFGKSLINLNHDEQKKILDNATFRPRKTTLEMDIGFKNQNQQQPRQKKRDAYHDLDRLNFTVEKENEANDFFGKGLADWQKGVTGNNPSKDATNLKKQFDEYEHSVLASVPKGGKRHVALADSLPKIKDVFLKQGHRFAVDTLNERSISVLDKGLQRIAQGALTAKDEKDIQTHDDAAFNLINKYVLSEAKFDEKDADAMYDKYLGYAGVDFEKKQAVENEEVPGFKPGFKMEDGVMLAAKDDDIVSDAGSKEEGMQPVEDAAGNEENEKSKNEEMYEQYFDKEGAAKIPASSYQYFPKKASFESQDELGKLSEKYESGKDGSHAISSGKGDLGGKSYGKYQMTSRHNGKVGGSVQAFVTWEEFPWAKDFEGLTPGTAGFDEKWHEIANKNPEEFGKIQDKFIYDMHYSPVAKSVQAYGIDADKQSKTLQQVFWSTGVQHGPNTNVVKKAVEKLKTEKRFNPSDKEFEAKLIEAIYDERKTRFGGSSKKVRENVQKRLDREKQDALDAVRKRLEGNKQE
ncbi:hypothetical protein [Pseudodesulfovibrio sp. JC047]|uniref:VgrG-related protein n=1 Tax=Pseudodesulfovibrio sp. JC047 TaxID=2683199 RepID=UPI00193F298B|nr:hypothetical protein [Pseudodesulfovibrio sp. JC047]